MFKILIIDDDDSFSYVFSLMLKNSAIEVEFASSGASALSLLQQYKPDLIFVDLILKDINGLELIKKIKSSNIDARIVVLSGLSINEDLKKKLTEDVNYILKKPVDKVLLTSLLVQFGAMPAVS